MFVCFHDWTGKATGTGLNPVSPTIKFKIMTEEERLKKLGYKYEGQEADGKTVKLIYVKVDKTTYCAQTGRPEVIPEIGDLAIFWDKGEERLAIIARLTNTDCCSPYFLSSNRVWYECAIRFRDDKQFELITRANGNRNGKAEEKAG